VKITRQQPALPTAKPQADTKAPKTKSEEELVLLRNIVSEARVFRRPSAKTGATWGRKVALGGQKGDRQGRRGAV
jgi:hypothetical protein